MFTNADSMSTRGPVDSGTKMWMCHVCQDGPLRCSTIPACLQCSHIMCSECEIIEI